MNYNILINDLYNEFNSNEYGNINNGCCVCDRTSFDNTEWQDKNKIFSWNCGYHKAFLLSLIEKSIYDIIHIMNIRSYEQILNNEQINAFKNNFYKLTKKCPLCTDLSDIDDKLKSYYRLPVNTGTIIPKVTISKMILDSDITLNNPILFDLDGYRGIGLYIFHSQGFDKVPSEEYYPKWELYKKYVTFDVIESWHDYCDGLQINDHLTINYFNSDVNNLCIEDNLNDDFIDLQNDIDSPIEILDNEICIITDYNLLNKDQLEKLLNNHNEIIINYKKFTLKIKDKEYFICSNKKNIKIKNY